MEQTIDWERYYDAYPVNRQSIWLNNCGVTPASTFVMEEMQAYLAAYALAAYDAEGYALPVVQGEIQTLLAKLLHCQPHSIALIHNTAEGISMVSHGLNLKAGDEVLIMQDEYPSNVYPWEHWQEKGVVITFIPMAATPAGFLENFRKQLTEQTRVVALSAVHWCTGMPLPLKEIVALCKARDILCVVDGAQGVGHVPIDVDGWEIPVLVFSCWKWLMGPLGMGCLIIRQDALGKIKPLFKGPDAVMDSLHYLPYQQQLKPTAERYMYSTANFNDWVYFRASLKMLDKIGFDKVQQRLYDLASYLAGQLKERGFDFAADCYTPGNIRSAIVAAGKPGFDAAKAARELQSQGIILRERQGRLRFAPHIYNSFAQMDRVIDVLCQHLEKQLRN